MDNQSPAPLESPFPEASKPDTSEPPVLKPAEEKKSRNKLVPLLVFLLLVALGVAGYFGWHYYQSQLAKETVDVQPEPSPVVEVDETAGWKIYEDKELSFSFKYPTDVSLSDLLNSPENEIYLRVLVNPVDELADAAPFGYTKANALSDITNLDKGIFGYLYGGLKESEEVIKISDNINAKVFSILRLIEVCNVQFVRKAIFYYKDHQIILTYSAPKERVISENKEYFSTEPANCGEMNIWPMEDNSPLRFYQALNAGQTVGMSQYWHDTFDQILSTFKFVDGENEVTGWKTYTNDEYKYSIKYPRDWIVRETAYEVTEPPLPVGTKLRYIGIRSPNEDYYLGFGIKKTGEEDVRLTSRTGVGAGDLAEGEPFKIGELQMPTQWLMFEGKVQDILGKQTTFNQYTAYAEFSYFGKDLEMQKNMNLITTPEYQTITKILSTFKLLN